MGVQRVRMVKARQKLGELCDRANLNDEAFRLERDGRPVAILVSVKRWNRQEAQLRALEKPGSKADAPGDAPTPF